MTPFRFDPDDRKQLLKLVGDGSETPRPQTVVEALELAVLRYQIATHAEGERRPSSKRQHVSELKKLQRYARKLDGAIASASPYIKRRILDEAFATKWMEGFPVAYLDESAFVRMLRSIAAETEAAPRAA